MFDNKSIFYINEKKSSASYELAHILNKCISQINHPWNEIILLCIGSDRITGDSLGPLIGHRLSKQCWKKIYVYGTLQNPVHALNLADTLEYVKKQHPSGLLVAIDASLGSRKHVGFITIGTGPLYPGAGVNKNLTPVGDLFITGILNESGTLEHLLLQTTRLSVVVQMAETIASGIEQAFHKNLIMN